MSLDSTRLSKQKRGEEGNAKVKMEVPMKEWCMMYDIIKPITNKIHFFFFYTKYQALKHLNNNNKEMISTHYFYLLKFIFVPWFSFWFMQKEKNIGVRITSLTICRKGEKNETSMHKCVENLLAETWKAKSHLMPIAKAHTRSTNQYPRLQHGLNQ